VARWVESTPKAVSWLGALYSANIAGAVLGCLLAGFYLLRVYDMATATYDAVAINGPVALVALLLSGTWGQTPRPVFGDEGSDPKAQGAVLMGRRRLEINCRGGHSPPLQSIRQKVKRATTWPVLGCAPAVGLPGTSRWTPWPPTSNSLKLSSKSSENLKGRASIPSWSCRRDVAACPHVLGYRRTKIDLE